MSKSVSVTLLMWLVCSIASGAGRDERSTASAVAPISPPSASAAKAEQEPVLDGEVLQDPAWQAAPVISGFWQTRPFEGAPASENTEVRIIYTKETLYFGIICYDKSPGEILATDSRRDSSLDDTDSFQLILDTYRDRQNGFIFGTNPAGVEYDAQVSKEGEGGPAAGFRQQGGSGGGLNLNWDASWEVRTKISSIGWSAEFAIPFKTLRFPSRNVQTWGMNFQRNIRRRQEIDFWSPIDRQFSLMRLSQAGSLADIEVPEQRNLKIMPYVLGKYRHTGVEPGKTNWLGAIGGDIKYSVTPSLTLDFTVKTDFAEVEVDDQQVNLDRFTLFFPEKRPFFLENAGLFSVGSPGEVEIFFSRSIGVGPGGVAVPILGGARLSGKLGSMNVGLLNMQTKELENLTPANNFTVGRISRELPNRSAIGAIFTNRQGTGSSAPTNDYNRSFAFDGRWGIGRFGLISGFFARSASPGVNSGQNAFKIGASRDSQKLFLSTAVTQTDEGFNPELGFLSRKTGFTKPEALIMYRHRPADFLGIHEIRPHVVYRGYWNREGLQETGFLHLDNHIEWRNGYELHTGVNFTKEGVTDRFQIYPGDPQKPGDPGVFVEPGTYRHVEAQLALITNQASWLSFEHNMFAGGFFGGSRVSMSPSVKVRKGDTFNAEVQWSRNDISLSGGGFRTNLIRTRLSYSFTPRLFIQGLIQYNDRDNLWSMNFRFAWLQAANTGIFIVYNDSRDIFDTQPSTLGLPDRSLTVKISHLFDIFN